jgi:hypothetical protein
MKTKRTELDVDFIGVQGSSLTKDEEKVISEYIRMNRLKKPKLASKKKVTV